MKKLNVLLLTNRDSDNVGDQIIEICDISLLNAVFHNLGFDENSYHICSRAASIISKKYLDTKDEKLLERAICYIKDADIIIFGGAPLFNYCYQQFYERTIVTLELAEKYHKPVIFSAVGIESYDINNEKCQALQRALSLSCVKQITTRGDFSLLQKYATARNYPIFLVSDPAVFSFAVFKNFLVNKSLKKRKRIGVFVLRAGGFSDNGIFISRERAAKFWIEIIQLLEKNDYDYQLLTSGHFADEAFLDYLIRNYSVKEDKCVFNINTPEQLVAQISSFDAVLSCRLHPSIIAYSLKIPAIGISWNPKVNHFYDVISYSDRVVDILKDNPEDIFLLLEKAIKQGVVWKQEYVMSVYCTLFSALQNFMGQSFIEPYSYSELLEKLSCYSGTSSFDVSEKLKRKFRRAYQNYNRVCIQKDRLVQDDRN